MKKKKNTSNFSQKSDFESYELIQLARLFDEPDPLTHHHQSEQNVSARNGKLK